MSRPFQRIAHYHQVCCPSFTDLMGHVKYCRGKSLYPQEYPQEPHVGHVTSFGCEKTNNLGGGGGEDQMLGVG
jgi:hypothetical protein